MKSILNLSVCFVLALFFFQGIVFSQDKPRYHNFKVTIKGFKSQQGTVRMALYNKRLFLNKKSVIRANALPVEKDSCVWILNKIDPGEYAILVYQDVNNNNKLDKSFLGKAKEPYVFSGNLEKKSRKSPKFEEVKFTLDENLKHMLIRIDK